MANLNFWLSGRPVALRGLSSRLPQLHALDFCRELDSAPQPLADLHGNRVLEIYIFFIFVTTVGELLFFSFCPPADWCK